MRRQHRFSRAFTQGVYAFSWPCGVIHGFTFLYRREQERTEKLDFEELIVPPGEKPTMIGDSECIEVTRGRPGGALHASHGAIINSRHRCVDRFHYRAHSKDDPVCLV